MTSNPSRWAREPLVHFLLLGAALFGIHAWSSGANEEAAGNTRIVVSSGRIRSFEEAFRRQWNRPPSQDELEGLIREFVREEVLTREAVALGLDRDDTIVRRRLAQKMEFLTDDLAAAAAPSDDELRAFLAAHANEFRIDARLTFTQIFLDPQKRGAALAADAARLLAQLNAPGAKPDLDAIGDSRLLDTRWMEVPTRDIAAQFGDHFAAWLESLPPGRWEGPIESGYGVHLVRIETRTVGELPVFERVRDAVLREWEVQKRGELKEARLNELLARYEVVIEPLPPGEAGEDGRRAEVQP